MNLNWKEIELLVQLLRPQLEGAFLDKIIIPRRELFPEGYLKGEWIIRFSGRSGDSCLLVSIRPGHPYIAWAEGKGPAAAAEASRSPFVLSLSKHLSGTKLKSVQALTRERVVVLSFSKGSEKLGLVVVLIPSAPQAYLVSEDQSARWEILARSRKGTETHYTPPDGKGAPADPHTRSEWFNQPGTLYTIIEKDLELQAKALHSKVAETQIQHLEKRAKDQLRQAETSLRQAEKEPDWQKLADLLKGLLGTPAEHGNGTDYEVTDYATGNKDLVPVDPKLTLQQQIAKYYQNSKKNSRRREEAQLRIAQANELLARAREFGTVPRDVKGAGPPSSAPKANHPAWPGKQFVTADDFVLHVGRNKDENLILTFKLARGNDLWLHVRGRPGAHAIVRVPTGKTVPLKTLLDAAYLVIYYSGGEKWGKTEVDYTFKKNVKRIKDSSEVSYSANKTLLVELDPDRLKQLLSAEATDPTSRNS